MSNKDILVSKEKSSKTAIDDNICIYIEIYTIYIEIYMQIKFKIFLPDSALE